MNKLLCLLGFLPMSLIVHAQSWTVPEENKCFITKITATWCGPCGGWGWDAFDTILVHHGDRHICAALYAPTTSELNCAAATELADEIGYTGTPSFGGNGEDVAQSSYQIETIVQGVEQQDTVFANAAFEIVQSTCDTIVLDVKTKFFEQMDGTFLLKAYLMENDVVEYQNNRDDHAHHHEVMRGGFLVGPGDNDTLTALGANQNDEFTKTIGIGLDSTWKMENFTIATTLWKVNPADPNDLIYINGTNKPQKGELDGCVSEDDDSDGDGGHTDDWPVGIEAAQKGLVKVFPNPAMDELHIEFTDDRYGHVQLSDLTGRKVLEGKIEGVRTTLNLTGIQSGLYVVRITQENGSDYLQQIMIE